MRLTGWLRRLRPKDPLPRISASAWNRICNVLEGIEGVGCRVEKSLTGHDWKIIIDPAESTDISPPVNPDGSWPDDRYEPGGPGSGYTDPCEHPGSESGDGIAGGEGSEEEDHPGDAEDGEPEDDDQDTHPGAGDCE